MKAKFTLLLIFMLALIMTVFAENKKEKIKVKGNCGMCEKRIEKAALDVQGVSVADWNKDTKELSVTFNNSKTTVDNIHKAVAAAGHDTDKVKATDEAYNKLHSCCKYDRSEKQSSQDSHQGHQH